MEGMEDNDISTFKLLLHTFAKMISIPGVQKMKHELKGHLSKDILRRVKTGKDLVGLLYNNGFLNDNKLMFFKKILRNASLHELEDILTEYVARKRASSDIMIEGTKREYKIQLVSTSCNQFAGALLKNRESRTNWQPAIIELFFVSK